MTTTVVKERPILFSAPMIRALLEGRKTQTRRIVKAENIHAIIPMGQNCYDPDTDLRSYFTIQHTYTDKPGYWAEDLRCPYGAPGDRLWVKETHMYCEASMDSLKAKNGESRIVNDTHFEGGPAVEVFYKAHASARTRFILEAGSDLKWRPSIHMHRWASRITLEITDVRVQRVEEISGEDAEAEGVTPVPVRPIGGGLVPDESYREGFLHLFYDINKRAKRGENPFVWALTFKVVQ